MRILLSCLLCLICTCVNAGSQDNVESDILAGYLLEWGTTRAGLNPDCAGEQDSIASVGECSTARAVDLFYLTSAIAHLGAKKLLPHEVSRYLGGGSALNVSAYVDNDSHTSISLRMSF